MNRGPRAAYRAPLTSSLCPSIEQEGESDSLLLEEGKRVSGRDPCSRA
jgi:hypothetical protein